MRINNCKSFYNGLDRLKQNDELWDELKAACNIDICKFRLNEGPIIKKKMYEILNNNGWAESVVINKQVSNASINFVKKDFGVFIQLGNVYMTHSILLKLQEVYEEKRISLGIIIVPMKRESENMGSNYAQFERLVREVELFSKVITIPLVVIGLED